MGLSMVSGDMGGMLRLCGAFGSILAKTRRVWWINEDEKACSRLNSCPICCRIKASSARDERSEIWPTEGELAGDFYLGLIRYHT